MVSGRWHGSSKHNEEAPHSSYEDGTGHIMMNLNEVGNAATTMLSLGSATEDIQAAEAIVEKPHALMKIDSVAASEKNEGTEPEVMKIRSQNNTLTYSGKRKSQAKVQTSEVDDSFEFLNSFHREQPKYTVLKVQEKVFQRTHYEEDQLRKQIKAN